MTASTRPDNRATDALRPVRITRGYTMHAEGSVLIEFGNTKVLCTASVEEKVPPHKRGSGEGWVTAEYGMLPRATHTRSSREAAKGKQSGRTQEIQRLIGRSLRAVFDLKALGERTISIDCDVLQADGGTRTASITGAYVAAADAVATLLEGRADCRVAHQGPGGRDFGGHPERHAVAGSRVRRRLHLRHRHERGHDRRRPFCGSAGHGRRRGLHAPGNGRFAGLGRKRHWRTREAAGPGAGCLMVESVGMKLVLASNNAGKLAELQALFAPLGVELVRQADLGIPEAPEPHCTFVENALAKARHAAKVSGLPALADDAGLCVEAFGGLPGVDTAYYATQFGYAKSDDNNVRALLEQLQGVTDRRAALVSTLVALRSAEDPEPLIATGRAPGLITQAPIGDGGFGFDPVMFLPQFGKTFAELSTEDKNANSHRGKAAQQMLALMRERWFAATPAKP